MRKGKIKIAMLFIALFTILIAPVAGLASSAEILVGEVNDSFQIVDSKSGKVYEVADTEKGNNLAEDHIGEKVKVTGTVEQDGDEQIIKIIDFEVLAE